MNYIITGTTFYCYHYLNDMSKKIIYQLVIDDVQEAAMETINRKLTLDEIETIEIEFLILFRPSNVNKKSLFEYIKI